MHRYVSGYSESFSFVSSACRKASSSELDRERLFAVAPWIGYSVVLLAEVSLDDALRLDLSAVPPICDDWKVMCPCGCGYCPGVAGV